MENYLIAPNAISVVSSPRRLMGCGIFEGTRKGVSVVVRPDESFDSFVAFVKTTRGSEYLLTPDLATPDLTARILLRVRYAVAIQYMAEDWRECITFPTIDTSFGASLIESFRATLAVPQALHTVRNRQVGRMGWTHTPRPDSPLRSANWDGFPSVNAMIDKLFAARTIKDVSDPRLK